MLDRFGPVNHSEISNTSGGSRLTSSNRVMRLNPQGRPTAEDFWALKAWTIATSEFVKIPSPPTTEIGSPESLHWGSRPHAAIATDRATNNYQLEPALVENSIPDQVDAKSGQHGRVRGETKSLWSMPNLLRQTGRGSKGPNRGNQARAGAKNGK